MSNAQTRIDIATALSAVAGINGHRVRPSALNEGDAWPQWRGAVPNAHAMVNTWSILIVMPQADDVTADGFADIHLAVLLDVLREVIFVDSVEPATIATDAGDMYALMISGRSE